jgi:hypothetical protein
MSSTININALPKSPSIVERQYPENVMEAEAYLYKYTNLNSKKVYVGVHKGEVGDGYHHSSKNVAFNQDLASGDSRFRHEILSYGPYDLMTVKEYEILKTDDAANNPLYYNMSNGIPKYKPLRMELINGVHNAILAKDEKYFRIKKEPVGRDTVLGNTPVLQPRAEDTPEHYHDISERVNDRNGNTDHLQVIVLENRSYEGSKESDWILDGNHSYQGVVLSDRGTEVNVLYVPKEIHEELTDAEVKSLGNLLNKRPENSRLVCSKADAVKSLVYNHEQQGIPAKDTTNLEYLLTLGFSTKKAASIQRKAEKEIQKKIDKLGGRVLIDWNMGPKKRQLKLRIETLEKQTGVVVSKQTSGFFKPVTLLALIYDNIEAGLTVNELVVLITHPTKAWYDDWHNKQGNANFKFLKFYLKPLNIDLRFKEMDLYAEDANLYGKG